MDPATQSQNRATKRKGSTSAFCTVLRGANKAPHKVVVVISKHALIGPRVFNSRRQRGLAPGAEENERSLIQEQTSKKRRSRAGPPSHNGPNHDCHGGCKVPGTCEGIAGASSGTSRRIPPKARPGEQGTAKGAGENTRDLDRDFSRQTENYKSRSNPLSCLPRSFPSFNHLHHQS